MSIHLAEPRQMFRSGIGDPQRFKVHFPDAESFEAARVADSPFLHVAVENERRRFISVAVRSQLVRGERSELPSMDELLGVYESQFGAEVTIDYQYDLDAAAPDRFALPVARATPSGASLDDMLAMIKAPKAWQRSRGDGVTIAFVDTGIEGRRPEFPQARRRDQWAPPGQNPWLDYDGHGTMAACIAAASRAGGGEFDGVAPDAQIVSCRTHFYDSELIGIYDFLAGLAEGGGPLIVNNSWGHRTGTPPADPPSDDMLDALDEAIARGVVVCFSAGNNHALAGGRPGECKPTSIWSYKCREEVFVVGAAKPDGSMWPYSSRGPGQRFGQSGTSRKPDVCAPVPPNGRVLYGEKVKSFPEGWGTSGACPQASGLFALLAAVRPAPREELFDAVRNTARSLGLDPDCQGTGLLDCESAVQRHG